MKQKKLTLTGRTILIVDDEELIREILVEEFQDEGAKTYDAESGCDAVKLLENIWPEIILSDVRMPNGDALFLLQKIFEICEIDSSKSLPLIFLCSGFNDISSEQAEKLKIRKIFTKPFKTHEIIKEIKNACD